MEVLPIVLIIFAVLCLGGFILELTGVVNAVHESINTKTSFSKNFKERRYKIIRNKVVEKILEYLYFKNETDFNEIKISDSLKLIKYDYIIAVTKKDSWKNGVGIYLTSCYDQWCHNYCIVTDKSIVKHKKSESIPKELIEQLYDDIYNNSDKIQQALKSAIHNEYYK